MHMNNNHLIPDLYRDLSFEASILNRSVAYANRYNVSIREKELFDRTQSVVFIFKITSKYSYLQFCCPLTPEQYAALESAEYVPLLRSGKYLTVGIRMFGESRFTEVSVRFPLDSGAIDFIMAMEYLHKEMEKYLVFMEAAAAGCAGT